MALQAASCTAALPEHSFIARTTRCIASSFAARRLLSPIVMVIMSNKIVVFLIEKIYISFEYKNEERFRIISLYGCRNSYLI